MLDLEKARQLLHAEWQQVASSETPADYIDNPALRDAIHRAINHSQVSYRFCLPTQLLGKLTDPKLDPLRLQRRENDVSDEAGWDARSLASKVIAPFNREQENVLGTSSDPYVGNPMRIPQMLRNDKSKKDQAGWNLLIDVLSEVQVRNSEDFTRAVFRQTLAEILRKQLGQRFSYPIPPRVSLEQALTIIQSFLAEASGGDRALAIAAALFEVIGAQFGIYSKVRRSIINASDQATGQAADLECLDPAGHIVLAVEVKDRQITLADVEDTIRKARQFEIRDVLFTSRGVAKSNQAEVSQRIASAFAGGQNVYILQTEDLARSAFILGGEKIRVDFLKAVGKNLDLWNTQPRHRKEWQSLLQSI